MSRNAPRPVLVPVGPGGRWKISRRGPAGSGAATRELQAHAGAAGEEPQPLVPVKRPKCSSQASTPPAQKEMGTDPRGSSNCQEQVMLSVRGPRGCSSAGVTALVRSGHYTSEIAIKLSVGNSLMWHSEQC